MASESNKNLNLAKLHNLLIPISANWRFFGLNINVEPLTLSTIDADNRNVGMKLYGVLEHRLQKLPLLTWQDVVRALRARNIGNEVLASEIESQYITCSSTNVSPTDSSASLPGQPVIAEAPPAKRPCLEPHPPPSGPHSDYSRFIEYVKALYRSRPLEKRTEVLKLSTPGQVFINLACIDRNTEGLRTEYDEITEAMVRDGNVDVIEGRKCPIGMNEIAGNLPAGALEKVILLEGAPGVGKSTFAWEFCRRWERGEIAQEYDLVLLLQLRDESIRKAKDWKDLILHPSRKVCDAVTSELEDCLGANVLLILEGYDELPDECRSRPSLFLELINGQVLPFATLMITSRPWATCNIVREFKHRLFKHIEVLGFTKWQITSYIKSVLSVEEALDLESNLQKHARIRMCMYIPINCAIVVKVYQECKAIGVTMPTTLTELYSSLTRTLLLRYLRAKDILSDPFDDFDQLPPAVYRQFRNLCELAYDSVAGECDHVKLTFTDLPADFDSLGFMDSFFELFVTRKGLLSHNFLHLTFQEFLAAVHISNLASEKRLVHFKRHKEGRLRVVLRFLAGLTKLKDLKSSTDFIDVLNETPFCYNSEYHTEIDYHISSQVSWVYEAQRQELVREAFNEDAIVEFECESDFDSSALGYCIGHGYCKWVLSIGRMIGKEDVENIVHEMKCSKCSDGIIIGLRGTIEENSDTFHGQHISTDSISIMFQEMRMELCELALLLPVKCSEILWPDLSSLIYLTLTFSNGMKCWGLASLLPNLSLKSLTLISRSYLVSMENCVAVANFVANTTSLKNLSFHSALCVGGIERIFAALADNESISLCSLNLEGIEDLSDSNMEQLANYIIKVTSLTYLRFPIRCMSASGALKVATALVRCPKLNTNDLTFYVNGQDVFCFIELVSKYSHLVDMEMLSEDIFYWIGDDGLLNLVTFLQNNSPIKKLDVGDNKISDIGAKHLAEALQKNSTIKCLALFENNIGDNGTKDLGFALCSNTTLKKLDLSNNDIGDEGVKALSRTLYHNSTLKELDLMENPRIGQEGVSHLIQALTVNESIIRDSWFNGLILDKKCETYAVKCQQYSTVKHRIIFTDEEIFQQQVKSPVPNKKRAESVLYIGNACSYTSETGISLHFPPANCKNTINVSVKAVSCDYTLPLEYDGMPLVSSMFRITASEALPAPLTVQLEHCALPDKEGSLVHVIAEDEFPYQFQPLHGGHFPLGKSHGEIKITKSSILAIIHQSLDGCMLFSVYIFYHRACIEDNTSVANIVVTRQLPAITKAIEDEYAGAIIMSKKFIQCDSTTQKLTLAIPPAKQGGWIVEPELNPAIIETKVVLEYVKGKTLPSIQLNLKWTGEGDPEKDEIEKTLREYSFESVDANLCPNLPGEGGRADDVPCEQFHLPQPLTPTLTLSDCTSDGGRYVDEVNDFSLEIPQGAISEGDRLTIDVGVALFGPFQFPEGLRPVSPVFWVCVRDKRDFEFSKPVTVTIPHFLNLNNHKDIQSLGLTFLKAEHEMNAEEMYNFKEIDGDAVFKPQKRCGTLKASHFCSFCIACRDTPEILEKTTFCITAVLPNSTIPVGKKTYAFFFVTFLNLKTCLRRVDQLISQKNLKGYETLKVDFKFQCSDTTDPSLEIDISQPKDGTIGVRGKKKILRSEVDIFTRKKELSEDELRAQENEEFYPPMFRLFLSCSQRDATLSDARIEFRGTTSDPEFGIYLDIPATHTVVSTESQVDKNKFLGISDLFRVKSQLMPVAARWRHIGLALGLRVHRLDSISSNSRTSEDCLTAVATDWLNRAYYVAMEGEPMLHRLSEAVRNPAGGNNPALALNILQNWTT